MIGVVVFIPLEGIAGKLEGEIIRKRRNLMGEK
jgi:hypothetical protein